MQRRDFLQTMAALGVSTALPLWGQRVHAAEIDPASRPLLITLAASGGWDPTLICDPKGSPINPFSLANGVQQVGAFQVPTVSAGTVSFFQKYYQKLLVINGVTVPTNSHEIGSRYTSCGSPVAGFPCFEALAAAAFGPSLGLSFVSGFGANATAAEVAMTGIAQSTVAALAGSSSTQYLNAATLARVNAARASRLSRLTNASAYPTAHTRMTQLANARGSTTDFTKVQRTVADLQANVPLSVGPGPDLSQGIGIYLQAQFALAGYLHGLTVSADIQGCQNTSVGSLDTHSNHDALHPPMLDRFFAAFDYLLRGAQYLGLQDRLFIYVKSDFGRTPQYNSNGGKDHYPVTSVMFMGPGITGNRVIGATDDNYNARKVNARTLQPDDSGMLIQPEQLQMELRRISGLAAQPVAQKYPISATPLTLLG